MSTDNDSELESSAPSAFPTTVAQPPVPVVLEATIVNPVVTRKDEQIAELQAKLADQTDKTNEAVFWLSSLAVLLADFLILPTQPWLIMVFAILFELLVGIHFAKKLGLEKIVVLLDSLSRAVGDLIKKK